MANSTELACSESLTMSLPSCRAPESILHGEFVHRPVALKDDSERRLVLSTEWTLVEPGGAGGPKHTARKGKHRTRSAIRAAHRPTPATPKNGSPARGDIGL